MLSGITTKQVTKVIATWILIEKRNYKQRLLNLKFFPNSHYIEMHDLLYLIKDPFCFTPNPQVFFYTPVTNYMLYSTLVYKK